MTGGPFKPAFGLSGAFLQLDKVFLLSVRVFVPSISDSISSRSSASCAVTEAAPFPILRTFTQPGLHRVPVDVAQLFHNLRVIPNVEIVVALLPEMIGYPTQAKSGLEWA